MGFLHDASEKRLTADDLDQAKRATGQLPVVSGGGLTSHATPTGTVVGIGRRPNTESSVYVGRIIETDSGDFDDERYYVAIQTPVGGEDDTENLLFSEGNADHDPAIVVVHNLAEWADGGGSHSLPSDGTRYVKITQVEDYAGTTRWVMSEGVVASPSISRVKATSTTGVSGTINVKSLIRGTTTVTGSEFPVQLVVSHAVSDIFYAQQTLNGTDFVGVDWIEHLSLKPTAQYQVLTPIDTTLLPVWTTARFS